MVAPEQLAALVVEGQRDLEGLEVAHRVALRGGLLQPQSALHGAAQGALAALDGGPLGLAQRQVGGIDAPAPAGFAGAQATRLDQVADLADGLAQAFGGLFEAELHDEGRAAMGLSGRMTMTVTVTVTVTVTKCHCAVKRERTAARSVRRKVDGSRGQGSRGGASTQRKPMFLNRSQGTNQNRKVARRYQAPLKKAPPRSTRSAPPSPGARGSDTSPWR
jgi:hypothetical protein